MIAGPAWIVTCSRPAPGTRDDLVAAVSARLDPLDEPGVGDAVTIVIDEAVDRMWDVSDDLDDRLAAVERTSLDDAVAAHEALQALRRDILVLHRAVGPLRRTLAGLIEERTSGFEVTHVADLHQSHDAVVELRGHIDTQLLLLNGL